MVMQIITTHINTDFDALASTIAATLLYPDAIPVLPGSVNPNVKAFLSIHKDLFDTLGASDIRLDEVERLIVVDVNRWERLGRLSELQHKEGLEVLIWDHHEDEGNIGPAWRCQEEVGATVTLMVHALKSERKIMTPIQATLFLAGIYEDTGNLTFSTATAQDAHAAGYLLDRKADLSVMNSFLRPVYGEKQKNILFQMLQTAERSHIGGYKVCIHTQEIQGHVGSLAVVVRMFREILNVEAAFGIFTNKEKNRSIVIGRSSVEGLNVGRVMRGLGGGGHQGAGSALVKSVDGAAIHTSLTDLIISGEQASARVSDLMSFPVVAVSPNDTMKSVAMLLREKGCTGVPVIENEALVGMISRRDFRKLKGERQLTSPVKAFMKRKVKTIDPGKSPTDAARLMVKHDIGRLPVVEEGRTIGILTRSDAMTYFYDLMPD